MTSLPDFWPFVVMVLASVALVKLVVFSSLIGSHLESGTGWSRWLDEFAFDENGNDKGFVRAKLATLLACLHCSGGWLSLAVVCLYAAQWPWRLEWPGLLTWLGVWTVQTFLNGADHKWMMR